MSGGSMDYLYRKLDDASFRQDTPQRKAFAALIVKVQKALHDIEWVDSGDYGSGDENEAIEACLAPGECLLAAVDEAKKAHAALTQEIERAQHSQTEGDRS